MINAQTRRLCTYCRLKKCFDVKMRKEWIRTDEERQVRELIKFNKQQRKLNKVPTTAIAIPNVPIVVRKKKRLGLHSTKSIQPKIVETKTEIVKRTERRIHRNFLEFFLLLDRTISIESNFIIGRSNVTQ